MTSYFCQACSDEGSQIAFLSDEGSQIAFLWRIYRYFFEKEGKLLIHHNI